MKKKIIIALMLLVMVTSVTFTAERYQEIGVFFGAVNKIFIDGEDKTSEFKEPFIYNGTTYVSLRDVSEALGQEVQWDAKAQSIYIGAKPVNVTYGEKSLSDMGIDYLYNVHLYRIDNHAEPAYNLDNDASFSYAKDYKMKIMEDSAGVTTTAYMRGLSLKAYDDVSAVYYDLDGNYDYITGKVGFDYVLNSGEYMNLTVRFMLDSKKVYEIDLTQEHNFEEFKVPVINGKRLAIELVDQYNNEKEPFVNIVDTNLTYTIYE